jgi:hypothetical protein
MRDKTKEVRNCSIIGINFSTIFLLYIWLKSSTASSQITTLKVKEKEANSVMGFTFGIAEM